MLPVPQTQNKRCGMNTHDLHPDYRSGDLVLDISAPEGASGTTYTVQSGDSLSKIGSNYGVSWQAIFEANRDKLNDPKQNLPGTGTYYPARIRSFEVIN